MPRPAPPKISSNPRMLESWDYMANERDPGDIPQTSREIFSWVCIKCGNRWASSAHSRLKSQSDCPRCALKQRSLRKITRYGSLAARFPDVSKEWDSEKNPPDLLPEKILPTVKTKIWWRCSLCDNSWLAKVESRTKMGAGCPKCSLKVQGAKKRQSSVTRTGSLDLTNPKIAAEWHPSKNGELRPNEVTKAFGGKVWWKCPKGHDYQAQPKNRTYGGTDCPLCRPQTSLMEIRFLSEIEAILGGCQWRAKVAGHEIDVWIPSLKLGIEIDGYPWHLDKEHADRAKSRAISALGGLLIHVRHELLPSIDEMDIVFSSRTPIKTAIDSLISELSSRGYIDQALAKHYVSSDDFINFDRYNEITSWLPNPQPERSLAYQRPDLAKQWLKEENLPETPASVTPGSHLRVKWRCGKDHVWVASVSNRARLNSGCPKCQGLDASQENNASKDLSLKKLWDQKKNTCDLQDLTPRSNKLVWWNCPAGHSFQMTPKNLSRTYSCPICSNRRVTKENSLASKRPALASLWDKLRNPSDTDPESIAPSSGKKFWWRCLVCEYSWLSSPNVMRRRVDAKLCPKWREH